MLRESAERPQESRDPRSTGHGCSVLSCSSKSHKRSHVNHCSSKIKIKTKELWGRKGPWWAAETRLRKVFSKSQNQLEKQEAQAASKYPEDGVLPEASPPHTHTHTLIALGCAHSSLLVNTAVVIVIFPEALAITPALTIWQLMGGRMVWGA